MTDLDAFATPTHRRPWRRFVVVTSLLAGLVGAAVPAQPPLRGVNMSGLEFGPSRLPGKLGHDYVVPTPAELLEARHAGFTTVRLPVLWERLQPTLNGPIDPAMLLLLRQFVLAAGHAHLRVIIDVHNYGSWRGAAVGSAAVPIGAFTDLWVKLARVFGYDPLVVFGLMNEPHDLDALVWGQAQQAALNGIRATGARNLVLVSGTGWDGAHNFLTGTGYATQAKPAANADVLSDLVDPGHNMAYELHQYLDSDFSGSHPDCMQPAQAQAIMDPITAWLRAGHRRGFLGETGAVGTPACLETLGTLLQAVNGAPDAWLGWAYWAGGPWWGNYMFSMEPVKGKDAPQLRVLRLLAAGRAFEPGGHS